MLMATSFSARIGDTRISHLDNSGIIAANLPANSPPTADSAACQQRHDDTLKRNKATAAAT
jgi:hypothetical protein